MPPENDDMWAPPSAQVEDPPMRVNKPADPLWLRLVITAFAALLSGIWGGLGQVFNRQWLKALVLIVLSLVLWFVLLGWLVHLVSIIDAAWVAWQRTGPQFEE